MKIFRIQLTQNERAELERIRRKEADPRSERALAVLLCVDGKNATQIAEVLKRCRETVCKWLNLFLDQRIEGLGRKYSPGRPSKRKTQLQPCLEKYLQLSPQEYGFSENCWSVQMMIAQYQKDTGETVSEDTVQRALHDLNYSFRRAKNAVPSNAPSKEDKLKRVKEIAAEIVALKEADEVEVMFLDETHFSTSPYISRGWFKTGQPFFPQDSAEARKLHNIWRLRAGKRCYLLEKLEEE